jgi:predicted Zn-dependent protease
MTSPWERGGRRSRLSPGGPSRRALLLGGQNRQQTASASGSPLLSRDEAKALADRVLAMSRADQTRVTISSTWGGNTRFADASITTSGGVTDTSITVTATVGRRRASSTTNSLDDASLKRTVETAAQLARLAPEDPELMPELGPQTYQTVPAFIERTADLDPETRASAVKRAVEAASGAGKAVGQIFSAGFLEANARAIAVATSAGLFAYHRTTDANFSMTARTPDGTGSGWASGGARDWGRLDAAAIGRVAAQKAVASRSPQEVPPGLYTAVLEPQAVGDLIPLLAGALNARTADEGRSPFSKAGGGNRIGEKVVDERVTLYSDPADSGLLAQPFDNEGLPIGRTVWIENGILRRLVYSRFWAQKQGAQPTGGAAGAGLALVGGTKSTEEIIAGCERGILVTHFFYIRSLEPRTVLNTGLTRDGTFLIEKGKITRALKNFRWNESPLLMLNRLEDIGRSEPTAAGRLMPALRIRDFDFTSSSDAV